VQFAHGLVQRANLPIPEEMFFGAAAVVLIVSFLALAALWPKPKLEADRWRPLPGGLGRLLGSRALEAVCGAAGVVLLIVVVVSGLAGTDNGLDNFGPTFIFIIFWVGLAFASALFGNIFAAFSPWRALGRAAGWAVRRLRGGRPVPRRAYPTGSGAGPPRQASSASRGSSSHPAGARTRA
jgi:hypothetical protein